jgi:hypothetical protein
MRRRATAAAAAAAATATAATPATPAEAAPTMLTYLPLYSVLVCQEHQHAIYSLDEHLKRQHQLPIAERRELLTLYSHLLLLPPEQVPLPELPSAPLAELGLPQDAWLCCYSSSSSSSSGESSACGFISTSRTWMRRHVNQQHSIKLSRGPTPSAATYAEHAAQLWKPVKVQTFFQERRYIRYFVVQEQDQDQDQEQDQGHGQGKPQTAEQKEADGYKQRLATLSQEWETVARKDSNAIERIAEEASAKDRTGWFKRTQ